MAVLVPFAERFKKKTKIILKIFSACATVLMILVACIQGHYIELSENYIYRKFKSNIESAECEFKAFTGACVLQI